MESQKQINIFTFLLILLSSGSVIWWLTYNPTKDFYAGIETFDRSSMNKPLIENVEIGVLFKKFSSDYTELSESWPRFRGADFDNISKSSIQLIDKFGTEGPNIIWSVEMGEGYAGAAIYKGLVYVLDYDEVKRADLLRCFELTSGKELWKRGYNVKLKRDHGFSRTIPAVTEKFVVTIGPRHHVMCVDRISGKFLWGLDIEKEYGGEQPMWYAGQCPLIDENITIIATGGKALLIAVDCKTGGTIWETPNTENWRLSHSSVMSYVFENQKMYVYCSVDGVAGIAAEGEKEGQVLWKTSAWKHKVIAPSPVCMKDGKIFLTAGYGVGSMMLQLSQKNGEYFIEPICEYPPKNGLSCEQQTPVLWKNHLFGVMPNSGGALKNQLVCVDSSNPQKVIWSSGKEHRFGLGPYFLADGKFFLLNDDGTLYIIKSGSEKYIELDHAEVIQNGRDAWAPMALANGYLVLRDDHTMVCVDLRKSPFHQKTNNNE